MSKIVLSGYYGFNNAGDEAILYAVIRMMKKIEPGAEITVLSNDPRQTEQHYGEGCGEHYGVKAVNRWKIRDVAKALVSCDLLISGGGSLLQDVTSANSPLYYLGVIMLARLFGKPVVIYAQGIGPLRKKRNRLLASWVLNHLSLITVRDQGSRDELLTMKVEKPVIVTADPVLGLKNEDIDPQKGKEILARHGIVRTEQERLLGVFIRSWGKNAFLPGLALVCNQMAAQGWKVVFIPLHFPEDQSVCRQAAGLMKEQSVVCEGGYRTEEYLSLTKNLDLLIGMRLHALVFGAVTGVPVVGLSYDPKIDRFLEQMGQQSLLSVENLNTQVLAELIEWTAEQREERWAEEQKRVGAMFQKAWQTARLVEELLKEQRNG